MDLRMTPYGCVATGDEQGMIEVVLNSNTVANITKEAGGGFKGAFREENIFEWIRRNNRDRSRGVTEVNMSSRETKLGRAIDNFMYSCAGYCVFTCVLGIGDRHNDNVMMVQDGHLFHIDFGHFLGNFKSKYGIRRERAPFVFTPDFAYVLGQGTSARDSQGFLQFVKTSCEAYNVVRKHSNLFIVLFTLMLSTGIPELKSSEDIMFLPEMLIPEKTDKEAAEEFTKMIHACLDCTFTQLNNAIHIYAHS
eukprot:GFYU01017067.1.p1 GENE.GFYU01017067.1~~GFYU01017067.1.p1  ORF type:complete len:263 (-),score=85.00 GFYU01017067.1:315-1064(-)